LTFDVWLEQVPTLSPDKQVQAVAAQLRKYNLGFDGKVQSTIEDNVVVRLEFLSDHITDISPLRALPRLKHLACAGSRAGKGRLADLSPLKDMKLQVLNCNFTRVADLAPLHGMPLRQLHCTATEVKDLTPLQGMPLLVLGCGGNPDLKDLSPLKGMPLQTLHMQMTGVSDLTPLRGMRLASLAIRGTRVKDLSPLKGMPLTFIACDIRGEETLGFLRTFPGLQTINQQPAAKFWAAAKASRVK
jgi:hypothetical protein